MGPTLRMSGEGERKWIISIDVPLPAHPERRCVAPKSKDRKEKNYIS
jgi:hypothetical protein